MWLFFSVVISNKIELCRLNRDVNTCWLLTYCLGHEM